MVLVTHHDRNALCAGLQVVAVDGLWASIQQFMYSFGRLMPYTVT
jgi:hypothetical protein